MKDILHFFVWLGVNILVIAFLIGILIAFVWITQPLWVWIIENGLSGIWNGVVEFFKSIWCGANGCN